MGQQAKVVLLLLMLLKDMSSFGMLPRIARRRVGAAERVQERAGKVGVLCLAAQDTLKFGDRCDISITLPTRNRALVISYLEQEQLLLEATWEKGKFRRLPSTSGPPNPYRLLFPTLTLPGVDTVSPEIDVTIACVNGSIELKSGNWTLRGTSGHVLKDSRFMESFAITIQGKLCVDEQTTPSPVVTRGWVEYRVQGEKPSAFKNAPPFVLDVTIRLIRETVMDFAGKQFANRFLRGFRRFSIDNQVPPSSRTNTSIAASNRE
jgi:hypothetical protein